MAQRYIYALALIFLAVFLWLEMFALKHFNFWIEMLIAASLLAGISFYLNHRAGAEINYRLYFFKPSYVVVGIISAAILYGVFFAGDRLSDFLFNFAGKQINSIYGNKTLLDPYTIALFLFFIIGPAEEIFWRGFVQDSFAHQFGENTGWILASAVYAAVHIVALNFILFAAALICGLFWGYMYKHYKSLWPGIISHALWDVTIFVLLPVR